MTFSELRDSGVIEEVEGVSGGLTYYRVDSRYDVRIGDLEVIGVEIWDFDPDIWAMATAEEIAIVAHMSDDADITISEA